MTTPNFEQLGLSPRTLEHVRRAGYVRPTPIQSAAIPVALTGRDLIGCAQTGTGKTAAFVLPVLERLAREPGSTCLVLAPTRELAAQIQDNVALLSGDRGPRVALILGGLGMEPQVRALAARPDIVIATPGRLIDHLQRGSAKLDRVSVLVLDEADRMLDMGFAPQIQRILAKLPSKRQTLLFSATMPLPTDPRWREVLAVGLKSPERVSVDPPRVAAKAEQSLWLVPQEVKTTALLELLGGETGSVLVFTRTKHRADKVARQLTRAGLAADRIHGNRSQGQRQRALDDFKSGKLRVLVATDIAARGLDVEGVAHVVNYDLPKDPEDYVHRVGRTARAERTGRATSFVAPEERAALKDIEKLTGRALPALENKGFARTAADDNAPRARTEAPRRAGGGAGAAGKRAPSRAARGGRSSAPDRAAAREARPDERPARAPGGAAGGRVLFRGGPRAR